MIAIPMIDAQLPASPADSYQFKVEYFNVEKKMAIVENTTIPIHTIVPVEIDDLRFEFRLSLISGERMKVAAGGETRWLLLAGCISNFYRLFVVTLFRGGRGRGLSDYGREIWLKCATISS